MMTDISDLDFRCGGDSSVSDAQYVLCYQTRKQFHGSHRITTAFTYKA
jgi:hypothetical protein